MHFKNFLPTIKFIVFLSFKRPGNPGAFSKEARRYQCTDYIYEEPENSVKKKLKLC